VVRFPPTTAVVVFPVQRVDIPHQGTRCPECLYTKRARSHAVLGRRVRRAGPASATSSPGLYKLLSVRTLILLIDTTVGLGYWDLSQLLPLELPRQRIAKRAKKRAYKF
jgi:hypothetical protein